MAESSLNIKRDISPPAALPDAENAERRLLATDESQIHTDELFPPRPARRERAGVRGFLMPQATGESERLPPHFPDPGVIPLIP